MRRFCPDFNVPRRRLSISLLALMLLFCATQSVVADQPPLGHKMNPVEPPVASADFTLPDMDGESHSLSDFRGQVVMLNFWATWCPPCRREMPSMQRLYAKYRDRGLAVVAVNQWEDEDLVFEFTGRLSLEPTFPILFDRESRVAETYGVKGLPTTYLLDREGNVRFVAIGGREFDHPDVEALIEGLL